MTSVTQPLLALGKFMRAGWRPTQDDTGMYLKHAGSGLEVPTGYKGNSLVVQASQPLDGRPLRAQAILFGEEWQLTLSILRCLCL